MAGATALGRVSAFLPRARARRSRATRRATGGARDSASSAVGPSEDAAEYRVLAFEDSYDIRELLKNADVRMGHFEQR